MWNANMYNMFKNERMQPSIDLVSRIPKDTCNDIIDIGCGSGFSTLPLFKRFPTSNITGVDLSDSMLEKARELIPTVNWIKRDCSGQLDDLGQFDIVFSNAFLQWLNNQEEFIKSTRNLLKDDGIFAIQIPGYDEIPLAQCVRETAEEFDQDGTLFTNIDTSNCHCMSLTKYYNIFSRYYSNISIWQTDYIHQMKSHTAIVDFIKSTALIPYYDRMNEEQAEVFIKLLLSKVEQAYKASENNTILFPFRRYFIIANK